VTRASFQPTNASNIILTSFDNKLRGGCSAVVWDVSKNAMEKTSLCNGDATSTVSLLRN
tara:strand:- start:978 stop:1154 length:177 start_codon:yes stop_codon:yes gene_type:complete